MEFSATADRTNAVAALLTIPFRRHFIGGKPFVLVTASKSHSGKSTLIEFIRGSTAKAAIEYEDKDWPMHKSLHKQLVQKPDVGVIEFDNVRTDTNRSKMIRSGFLESFITNREIILCEAGSKPLRTDNRFVVVMNTNEGSLSIDLLNRCLPVRLDPHGDLTERLKRCRELLGGDVKHEWLPAHRKEIEKELWGMIERWNAAGRPLDETVRHPMGPWAKTIGGILLVNGFTDFLKNYSVARAAADPIREALSFLAFYSTGEWRRADDLALLAVKHGQFKVLLPNIEKDVRIARETAIGKLLSRYIGETFSACSANERITYRLSKHKARYEGTTPHWRYKFEVIDRAELSPDETPETVLEQPETEFPTTIYADDFSAYEPETL